MLSDFCRLYQIVTILLSYGLDTLLPWPRLPLALRLGRGCLFWMYNRYPTQPLGVRLRLALQALGPVWIKFGQMLSTRRDLIPESIIQELTLLQDRVDNFPGQVARALIEQRLGGPLEQWFDDFDLQPLASASIAQVHTARLKHNGQAVVLKVIRPGITPLIKADIKLMYYFAAWLERCLPDGQRLRVVAVVNEYESTLLDELDLMREAANMIQFRHNFERSALLYVPKVYVDYCREQVLVSEQIKGIAISDVTALKAYGINLQQLAERGVQLFFTQVFRDSLFHADMHPGNIFVSFTHPHQPQYIAVDYGVVGTLNREDKRYLAGNFIAFFNRDYRQVAQLHVDSGWVPAETNIEQFEFAIRTVCEPIFQKPLAEISFGRVLLNLFNTARRFNMTVQPQLILLQKTLLYVEGLGRQLYPQLDLWTTAKPFLETWMREQVGWLGLWRTLREKSPVWIDKLPEIPELWYANLRRQRTIEQQLTQLLQQQHRKERYYGMLYWFGLGMTLFLCAAILFIGQSTCCYYSALAGIVAWLLSWRLVRKSREAEKQRTHY